MTRPSFIKHYEEIQSKEAWHYPNSDEPMVIGSAFGDVFGLKKLGIHHEALLPGRRTSWPHAERDEEEFVYVIEGHPDVWIDGRLYSLNPGDGVGFPCGTGIAHTFINNTSSTVRLLTVGEKSRKGNQIAYPLHPKRNEEIGDRYWADAPKYELGDHDGLPDARRRS